ncbi:MAG: endonuclease domain-containing protein [Microthrixaceae bacterium]
MYDELAVALAESSHGIVAVRDLRSAGATRHDIQQLRRSRHWEAPTPAVLRRVGSPATTGQAVAVAVLDGGPGAALSHMSSAGWWGLRGCPLFPLHIVRLGARRRSTGGVTVHRVRALPVEWVTELEGIPVVRPELCALHLFAVCHYERAERLVDRLWADRLLSGSSLRRFVKAMGAMGRNGTAGVRRYLDDRPGGWVPPASGIESRMQQLCREAGISVRRQVDLGSDVAWSGRVDFLVDGLPLIIEVQSERHHTALTDRTADASRRAALEAAGFVVVEVWDAEVWTRPDLVVARIRRAIRSLTPAL